MRALPKLRDVEMMPVRVDRVPSVQPDTREAIAHVGGAPVLQRWDIDHPRVAS